MSFTLCLSIVTLPSLGVDAAKPCSLKAVDVRALKTFEAFAEALGNDVSCKPAKNCLVPAVLKGATDGWKALEWNVEHIRAKLGHVKVWPRDLRDKDHLSAPRVKLSTVQDYVDQNTIDLAISEAHVCPITRAMEGSYSLPRPFRKNVYASPLFGMCLKGAGSSFHKADSQDSFASWVAQVHGSTRWLLWQPTRGDAQLDDVTWPWDDGVEPKLEAKGVAACTLEPGDAIFVPRGYRRAWLGLGATNIHYGWQGMELPPELQAIFSAVTRGDPDALAKQYEKLPDSTQYLSPLVSHGMQTGHVAVLKQLVKLGANLDEEDPSGATYLHSAASAGQADAIRFAIEQGADPMVPRPVDKMLPIHLAAFSGHVDVIEALIKKAKSCHTAKDAQGSQPLHTAAVMGHAAAAKMLVQSRAKIDGKDKHGFQAVHWAANGNHEALMDAVISLRADVNVGNVDGETPLHRAVQMGHSSMVLSLISRRANIEAKRSTGQTAVHTAAYLGQLDMLKLLHAQGANLAPAAGKNQHTPEGLASSAGHADVVNYFRRLRYDKKIKATNTESIASEVSTFAALQAGHLSMLKNALEKEIRMGPPEEHKFRFAHEAVRHGHLPQVEFLTNGGETLMERPSGTLMQMAAKHGHATIVQYLAHNNVDVNAHGVPGEKPLHLAVGDGHNSVVEKLIKLAADVNIFNDQNLTALHVAVMNNQAHAADVLMTSGASVAVQHSPDSDNSSGRQHLHVAAASGGVGVAKSLLKHRADFHVKDKADIVPMFLAAEHGHVAVMKLLVEHRADITYKVAKQTGSVAQEATVFGIAAAKGHVEVIKYLAKHLPVAQTNTLVAELGDMHGLEWQRKLEKELKLFQRLQQMNEWKEAMSDPDKKQRIMEFNEKYAQMTAAERRVIDSQIAAQHEADKAKQAFDQKEKVQRVSKPVEEL